MDNRKSTTPAVAGDVATVFVAIELSGMSWLAGMQTPRQERPGRHQLASADAQGLWALIERERSALQRAGWARVRVVTCYEAGRDGFWLHRFLVAQGAESFVVDPGSVEVNRRARRAKSDGLDVESLLRLVIRYDSGDRHHARMVVVPSIGEEDARRPGRERRRLLGERTAHSNRIQGLLATHGVYGYRPLRGDRWVRLEALRCADGEPLPAQLHDEMVRELHRLEFVDRQIVALEKQRAAALAAAPAADEGARRIRALRRLRGIDIEFATTLVREVYYRKFANRRKVASYVGLAASPFRSGRASPRPAMGGRAARRSSLPGCGCGISRTAP